MSALWFASGVMLGSSIAVMIITENGNWSFLTLASLMCGVAAAVWEKFGK